MSKELEQDLLHIDEANALLPEQFKNSENLKAFIATMINRVQEADNMLFDLWQSRWIDNATGVQLDGLGAIIGVARDGYDDATYKIRIRARIQSNVSNGTADDVLRVAALLASSTGVSLAYQDLYPAGFQIILSGGTMTADIIQQVSIGVKAARPAGVSYWLLYSLSPKANTFTFGVSTSVQEADTDKGFGPEDQSAGGHLAGVLTGS